MDSRLESLVCFLVPPRQPCVLLRVAVVAITNKSHVVRALTQLKFISHLYNHLVLVFLVSNPPCYDSEMRLPHLVVLASLKTSVSLYPTSQ